MLPPEDSISKTKLVLPKRRADTLSRARLLGILDERLDRKLVIISAPAGYGKTSLLIDLASHSEMPFCWLALDPLDREPQRFVACIVASLELQFNGFGKRTKSLLSSITDMNQGMERLVATLVNEILSDIHQHFVLVFDDFHLLENDAPVLIFVNRFLQLMSENVHVIISSRTLPALPDMTLMVAREEVGGLDMHDLAFRPAEIQSLMSQNRQIHLADDEAERLFERTEGWITGLQFTDLVHGRTGDGALPTPDRLGVTVFDYLGQQVLEQQPPEMQRFMLRTSLLEEFDAALCSAVLRPMYAAPADWAQLIETLVHNNLFTLPVEANGQWVRYHHLFRDYLQERLRAEHPEEVQQILRGLARSQEAAGQWERAYETLGQLGEPEAVADLVEHAGIPMYQHAMLTLDSWLKNLPASLANARPGLLSLRGAVEATKGNVQDAVRLLTKAIERFPQREIAGKALALARRGNARRLLGDYAAAMQDFAEAARLTEADDNLQWIHADAIRGEGLCLYRQGQTLQALSRLDRALGIYTRIKDMPSIPLLHMESAMVHAARGDYRDAETAYERALELWRSSGNLIRQAGLLNNLAVLHQQVGKYEKAVARLEEGLACAQGSGDNHDQALILLSLGDVYAELGDWEMADSNYRRAADMARELGEDFLINYCLVARALLALLRRDLPAAHQILSDAETAIHPARSRYEYAFYLLACGRLSLQENERAQAVAYLAEATKCFEQDGRESELAASRVWLAAGHAVQGESGAARRQLEQALEGTAIIPQSAVVAAWQAGEWLGRLQLQTEPGSRLRRLLAQASRLGEQMPRMRRNVRRLAHAEEPPAPGLVVHTFGGGQVWLNGKALTIADWQTQSVRELFFFFLAAGRPLSREQIGAALWPGTEEPGRFKMRFKNEIYRLRRAVGQETVLFDGEMYYFNAAIDHSYDVEEFEAYLAHARSVGKPAEKIDFYERAIALVQGRYLQDIGASWILPDQERLHQLYLAAVEALVRLYQAEAMMRRALELCQRVLAADRTFEAGYRLLMETYHRLGDRGSVAHVYQTCEAVMREVYGLPPSEDTQRLYRALSR